MCVAVTWSRRSLSITNVLFRPSIFCRAFSLMSNQNHTSVRYKIKKLVLTRAFVGSCPLRIFDAKYWEEKREKSVFRACDRLSTITYSGQSGLVFFTGLPVACPVINPVSVFIINPINQGALLVSIKHFSHLCSFCLGLVVNANTQTVFFVSSTKLARKKTTTVTVLSSR